MSHSVYLHIPFCKQRCSYCDFSTYTGMENIIPEYVGALCSEIQYLAASSAEQLGVHTVYFGGGTPSLLSIDQVERILVTLDCCFDLQPDLEVTLEANPGTLSSSQLRGLYHLGVNRFSLGMQSALAHELHLLGRIHNYPQITRSVEWARRAGFNNLNLDLIYGLPEQTLESWKQSLNTALSLEPEHFSLYALTLEHGTPMEGWVRRGLISEPDPDLAAEMYEWAMERLDQFDYAQYEISNWAHSHNESRKSPFAVEKFFTCRHNLQYWYNLPYLGFGAGAHGYAGGMRTANVSSPVSFIQLLENSPQPTDHNLQVTIADQQPTFQRNQPSKDRRKSSADSYQPTGFPATPAMQDAQSIDLVSEMGETMMMGLRLTQEGVSKQVFYRRFGQRLEEIYGRQIERLIDLGLLVWAGSNQENLRLTPRGRLLGNRVFMEFI